jgi:hypothetical protein
MNGEKPEPIFVLTGSCVEFESLIRKFFPGRRNEFRYISGAHSLHGIRHGTTVFLWARYWKKERELDAVMAFAASGMVNILNVSDDAMRQVWSEK